MMWHLSFKSPASKTAKSPLACADDKDICFYHCCGTVVWILEQISVNPNGYNVIFVTFCSKWIRRRVRDGSGIFLRQRATQTKKI
jgi:hypothetical protein